MATGHSDFSDDAFGDPIHRITRASLIEDGTLTDLSGLYADVVNRSGIKCHVAMSTNAYCATVWPLDDKKRVAALESIIEADPVNPTMNKDIDVDHVRRVLSAYVQTAKRQGPRLKGPPILTFAVTVRHAPNDWREIDLKAIASAGDEGEPVLTILHPHED